MKSLIKFLTYSFIAIGSFLLIIFILKIYKDGRIFLSVGLDLNYLKKIGESAQVLAITWNIIGVLLIVLTLNIQKEQFLDNKNFIEKQQFETTFFNMLNILYNIKVSMKKEIDTFSGKKHLEGQNLVDFMRDDLKSTYDAHFTQFNSGDRINILLNKITSNTRLEELEKEALKDEINKSYLTFYASYHTELGHYFRYLFNLLKFTLENREKYDDHKTYINLVQAQLSNNELALIYYNVLSSKSLNKSKSPQFYHTLEDYNFFENIDEKSLLDRRHHILFPKTNFKFLNRDEIQSRAQI